MFGMVYRYRTRGIFGGCTELTGLSGSELTEVSDSGIKFVPNHTGVFGRVLRLYQTLPNTGTCYRKLR